MSVGCQLAGPFIASSARSCDPIYIRQRSTAHPPRKKIFPFKQTFEIEFHLTKSKMRIWKVQVTWVSGTWAGTTFGHLRNWAIYLECRNRNLNGNIRPFECTNKSSFGWRGASGWLDRKFRILKAPGLQRKGLSCEAEIAGTPLGTNL